MSKLNEICDFLNECGFEPEIRNDRIASYVNIGDVKSVRNRMQFWISKKTGEIEMYVGTEMGILYTESKKLMYLDSDYRYSFKENKVVFPTMDAMKDFINSVV